MSILYIHSNFLDSLQVFTREEDGIIVACGGICRKGKEPDCPGFTGRREGGRLKIWSDQLAAL